MPQVSPFQRFNDFELIDAIIGGDDLALNCLLIERCGPAFKRLCQMHPAAKVDLEDITQEVCLILLQNNWKALREFNGRNSATNRQCQLTTYVITCAVRWIRKKSKALMSEIVWSTALIDEEGNQIDIRDEKSDNARLDLEIHDAIMTLRSCQERYVLLEHKIKGRSPAEVAADLNTSVANIYTISSRATKNLRILLTNGGDYA